VSTIVGEFRILLRARNSLIWVVTGEERRAERMLANAAATDGWAVRFWDCATGAYDLERNPIPLNDLSPHAVFGKIRDREKAAVWILRDLHPWLADFTVERALKSLARDLQDEHDQSKIQAIVVLSPSPEIPLGLRSSTMVLDWPLPDRKAITRLVERVAENNEVQLAVEDKEKLIDAAAGLAASDIEGALARSLVEFQRFEPGMVATEKKRIIDRERVLTWYPPDPRGMSAIGGLDNLKRWLARRRLAFSQEARDYGLPTPRGILLVGPPGCGKSASAKAIPTAWGGMPLLRLDLGATKGSLVGQSEGNIRRALKIAEAVAPAVLWLDEIEKAMAGATGYSGDSGVSADQLGAVLTWLQERQGDVFVVATANDVRALPPELSRKGRFDEVFFIDLPTPTERTEILATALVRFGRDPGLFNLASIGTATEGYSGAEVAELVPTAMFQAFADDGRPLRDEDLVAAAAATVPMATSAKARIDELREWAKGRAVRASDVEGPPPTQTNGGPVRLIREAY
jgi:hypothetical protein